MQPKPLEHTPKHTNTYINYTDGTKHSENKLKHVKYTKKINSNITTQTNHKTKVRGSISYLNLFKNLEIISRAQSKKMNSC